MNRDDRDRPWLEQAACTGLPPHEIERIFFPGLSHRGTRKHDLDKPALKICGQCPVRLECLRFAIQNEELVGTWGGMPDHARRHLFHKGIRTDRGKTA